MSVLRVNIVHPSDLPVLQMAAAQTGWDHLTAAEQVRASRDEVSHRAWAQLNQAMSTPHSLCLVARDGEQVVAYELLVLHEDDISGISEALKLDGWVSPSHRGRGLNQYMHQLGEDWCRHLGVQRMTCVVAAHNAPSLRATSRSGFETERLIRAKWL